MNPEVGRLPVAGEDDMRPLFDRVTRTDADHPIATPPIAVLPSGHHSSVAVGALSMPDRREGGVQAVERRDGHVRGPGRPAEAARVQAPGGGASPTPRVGPAPVCQHAVPARLVPCTAPPRPDPRDEHRRAHRDAGLPVVPGRPVRGDRRRFPGPHAPQRGAADRRGRRRRGRGRHSAAAGRRGGRTRSLRGGPPDLPGRARRRVSPARTPGQRAARGVRPRGGPARARWSSTADRGAIRARRPVGHHARRRGHGDAAGHLHRPGRVRRAHLVRLHRRAGPGGRCCLRRQRRPEHALRTRCRAGPGRRGGTGDRPREEVRGHGGDRGATSGRGRSAAPRRARGGSSRRRGHRRHARAARP